MGRMLLVLGSIHTKTIFDIGSGRPSQQLGTVDFWKDETFQEKSLKNNFITTHLTCMARKYTFKKAILTEA